MILHDDLLLIANLSSETGQLIPEHSLHHKLCRGIDAQAPKWVRDKSAKLSSG